MVCIELLFASPLQPCSFWNIPSTLSETEVLCGLLKGLWDSMIFGTPATWEGIHSWQPQGLPLYP